MSSFENTLARMKSLYTYGKELNESNKFNAYTLEHSSVAADGKTYGIIRECNKYYIKLAQKGKETIAESYDYIGGICNKKNYEYTSYNNALKNFELKMASINEACDGNVNISTLDPFKKGDFIVEGTDKMKNEIARQRQIMYNVSMLMNEGTEIGASRKNDVVKFDGKQPEAETGKRGDEGMTNANPNPEYKGSKTNGVDKKVAPYNNNTTACEDQLKESCECNSDSCDCKNDWASQGIGKGRDPKTVGWDIEGQQTVNEEENDWASKGLPSTPGVGDADTKHNNEPFNNAVNENEEMDFSDDVEDSEVSDDIDLGTEEDFDSESDFDNEGEFEGDDEFGAEDDFDTEDDFDADEDFDTEEDFNTEEDFESDEDILSQIDELQAQIDALRSKIEGDNFEADDELDADSEFESDNELDSEDNLDIDNELDSEGEFSDEDNFETEDELSDEEDFGAEDEFEDNIEEDFNPDFIGDGRTTWKRNTYANHEDLLNDKDYVHIPAQDGKPARIQNNRTGKYFDVQTDDDDLLHESKKKQLDSIVESIVNSFLNEDELHAFGKHPGYQKKPMELPSTGEDKNQWGEDWNDESVYSEEPFGTKIGDSSPFEKAVNTITNSIMERLSEEVKKNKKKVK
jgi:hypothetical protein